MKAFARKHIDILVYLFITAVFIGGLQQIQASVTDKIEQEAKVTAELLYQNALDGCDRGNLVRQVIYANTKQAAILEPNASYEGQLKVLQSVPTTDPETGTIDCESVVVKP